MPWYIYYLTGKIPFRTQLVITRQLKGTNHLWLRVLNNDLCEADAKQFVSAVQSVRTNSDATSPDVINVDALTQVVLSQNPAIFERIKKEDPMMCDALKELMKPEIEEGRVEGGVNALFQIGWTPSQIAAQLHLSEDRVNEIIKKIQPEH